MKTLFDHVTAFLFGILIAAVVVPPIVFFVDFLRSL